MITADHAVTAGAIGHAMGIDGGQEAVAGAVLELAGDDELRVIVRESDILAGPARA